MMQTISLKQAREEGLTRDEVQMAIRYHLRQIMTPERRRVLSDLRWLRKKLS